jgi:hypothetical protein
MATETFTFNSLTGNWIKETTTTTITTGTTVFTGGPGGPGGGTDDDGGPSGGGNPSIEWENWRLLTESISSWDPNTLGALGIKNTTGADNGHKWGIKFKITFDMPVFGRTAYPLSEVVIRLCKVSKNSSGIFTQITDNTGKKWSSQNFPGLKEIGKDLPSEHFLSGKLTRDQGTYEAICDWYISEDVNYFNGNIDQFDKSTLRGQWTLDQTKKDLYGITSLKKELEYFIPYDLYIDGLIKPYRYLKKKSTTSDPYASSTNDDYIDNYELEKDQHYFLMVIPLYPEYKSQPSAAYYTGFNSSTLRYRKGEVVGKNWPTETIIDSDNYETEYPKTRKITIPQQQFKPIEPVNGQIYESTIAWFKTPNSYYVNKIPTLVKNYIKSWISPSPSTNGYWYQLYDSWSSDNKKVYVRPQDDDRGSIKNPINIPSPTGYNFYGYGGHFDFQNSNYNLKYYVVNGKNTEIITYPIHYYFNYTFEKDYNYLFRILLPSFQNGNLTLTTPWQDKVKIDPKKNGETIEYNVFSNINAFSSFNIENNVNLWKNGLTNEYSIVLPIKKPINKVVSSTNPKNPITFTADTNFSSGIEKVTIHKTKWFIQGYASYSKYLTNSNILDTSKVTNSVGWHYKQNTLIYYYPKEITIDPYGGDVNDYFSKKSQNQNYITNNFISRYIKVQTFNMRFDYTNNSSNLNITIYTGIKLPTSTDNLNFLISEGTVKKIGTIFKSNNGTKQNCEYIGLQGNQYVFIIASGKQLASENQMIILENFVIEGEYHPLNNTLFKDLNNMYKSTQNFSSSFNIKLGSGNNVDINAVNDIYIVNSKIGNSNFQSGIWETGVWQSGWRDSKQYAFIDVDQFFSYDNDRIWRFIISGNTTILSNYDLNVGDKISISNIVAIDINSDRRLIKNYFTISEISGSSIVVEFIYDFPIKSIEKDSENHLIMVTKSIWLHGIFLNGRFKGNWIDGIFKGYPFITKMEESHWIDGDFYGGKFKSDIIKYDINNTEKTDVYIIINTIEDNQLQNGDEFYLASTDKITNLYVKLNNERKFKVLSVINSKSFYSDIKKDEGIEFIQRNGQKIFLLTTKNSALIQNMNFDSYNTSDKTISKSFVSEYIFSYNSWLDLVYDNSSATNIFKLQNIPDNFGGFYSENNLYGYITNDVLSSVSKFKDSFSNTIREYKLGTKWKIFYDYIGESSSFDEYFHSVYTPKKTSELGWLLNVSNNPIPSISRFIAYRTDDKNEEITGKELKLVAEGDGGILNLDNRSVSNIPLRYTEKIKSNGYSFISFDLISNETKYSKYQKGSELSTQDQLTWYNGTYSIIDNNSLYEPILNFSNINQTHIIRGGKTYNTAMTYLPINQNINHLETKNKTKIEYFFNKRDLMISLKGYGLKGVGTASVVIDNLKFNETDMIPFFQYFTIDNINKGVQIPNGIDYVKFDYKTSINYNYVSYTSNKTYNYFDVNKFKSTNLIDDSFWLKDNSLNSLNINDFFNRSI